MMRDSDLKAHALRLWANFIETGNVTLSAGDVAARNASVSPNARSPLHKLDGDQQQLVMHLRSLASAEVARNSPSGRCET
jgi:hypothetical protein